MRGNRVAVESSGRVPLDTILKTGVAATPGPDAARKTPEPLKVTTPVLPLSLTKLFLAASWWDRALSDRSFDCTRSATPDKIETAV